MKVAIIGFAKGSRDSAPYADPSWQIWGINGVWKVVPRLDRVIDLHAPWIYEWETARRPPGHLEYLRAFPGQVVLIEKRDDMPTSISYPLNEVIGIIGRPYLTSSVAMAVGLAMLNGAQEIGLWGVEMTTVGEYADQRPCLEWLLGVAEARGIKVTLPDGCPILSGPVYGRGDLNPGGERITPGQFERRMATLQKRENDLIRQAARLDGAAQEAEHTLATGLGVTDEYRARVEQLRGDLVETLTSLERIRGMIDEARYWLAQTPEGAPQALFRRRVHLSALPTQEMIG